MQLRARSISYHEISKVGQVRQPGIPDLIIPSNWVLVIPSMVGLWVESPGILTPMSSVGQQCIYPNLFRIKT